MAVLVTGGTGAVGRRLLGKLDRPRVLARTPANVRGAEAFAWASDRPVPDEAMRGVDTVVNLAGEPTDGRWTAEKKARIRASRVDGTRNLVDAIARAEPRPKLLVSASAIGIYGDRGDELLDESSAPGDDFLADVCRAWEAEAMRAESLGVRVVRLRIGLVLMRGDGLLRKLVPVFKTGLGGRLGDGRQWMSWVHVDDLIGLVLHAMAHPEVEGAVNATAPNPVTNAELARTLGAVLHRPALVPTPKLALRAAFGELASVILASQRVVPRAAERFGYRFRHPELAAALRAEV